MVSFDPYLNWLGIPPHEQPPNFYRLLGVVIFESNPEVIEQAANYQSMRIGAYQGGGQDEVCQRLLTEIAMAQYYLLDPQQKAAYDGQLQGSLAQYGELACAPPPPPAGSPAQYGELAVASPPPPAGSLPPRGELAVAPPPPPASPAQGSLAQHGERVVASPPSPASMPGPLPFSPPPQPFAPQFPQSGPQGGRDAILPGQAVQGPMTMPGLPPPMQVPMPGVAAMSGPAAMSMPSQPQPVMQMPPSMMPASAGFAPAMPHRSAPAAMPVAAPFPTARVATTAPAAPAAMPQRPAPAAMPVAAPFPTARAVAAGSAAAAPAASPTVPPAAPQRPIDELESLTSRPTTRRRGLRKRKKTDYTKEIVIGCVLAAGVLLIIAYAAVKLRDPGEAGFDAIKPETPAASPRTKLADEHKRKLKEILKEKEKEKEKQSAVDNAPTGDGTIGPLKSFGQGVKPRQRPARSADDADTPLPTPHEFGPPTRSLDSPDPGRRNDAATQPDRHDITPQNLGGVDDPVMGMPKP